MSFSLESWKTEIASYFAASSARLQPAGVDTLYGWLVIKALMPAVIATQLREPGVEPVINRLLTKGSAGPILALLQRWPGRPETELAREMTTAARSDAHLRRALDTLLQKLDVIALAGQDLSEADRQRFAATLEVELRALGSRLDAPAGGTVPPANPLDRQRRTPRSKPVNPLVVGLGGAVILLLITSMLGWGRASRTARYLNDAYNSLAIAEGRVADAETRQDQANTRAADADAGHSAALAQADIILARLLAVQADNLKTDNPANLQLITLLALESVQRNPINPANNTLMTAASLLPVLDYQIDQSVFIRDIAIHPDGSQAASVSEAGINIWDLKTGSIIFFLEEANDHLIRYSPDGRWLLAVGTHGSSSVWDTSTGQQMLHVLSGSDFFFSPDSDHLTIVLNNTSKIVESYSYDIATGQRVGLFFPSAYYSRRWISPNGQWVLGESLGPDGMQYSLWNLSTQQQIATIKNILFDFGYPSIFVDPVFSADSRRLVYYTMDNRIEVMDLETGQVRSASAEQRDVLELFVNTDGSLIAADCGEGYVRFFADDGWPPHDGEPAANLLVFRTIHATDRGVYSLAFSPDNRWVVLGEWGGYTRIWDLDTGQAIARLDSFDTIGRVAFSPDGQQIITAGLHGFLGVWQLPADPGFELPLPDFDFSPNAIAFSPDGGKIHAINHSGLIYTWRMDQKNPMARVQINLPEEDGLVVFSPSGNLVAYASTRTFTSLKIWDSETGAIISDGSDRSFGHFALALAFSPDDRLIALGNTGGDVYIAEISSVEPGLLLKHDARVEAIAFSPDGQWLVSGGHDGSIKIWDLHTAQELGRFFQDAYIQSVAFSADGQWIYSASQAGEICVWEISTDTRLGCQSIPQPDLIQIVFSPDSHHVATRDAAGMVQIWQVFTESAPILEAGRPVLPDNLLAFSPNALVFSPDGRQLAFAASDSLVHLWPWSNPDLTAAVCARLRRNLTQSEWDTYFLPDLPYHQTCPNLPSGQDVD